MSRFCLAIFIDPSGLLRVDLQAEDPDSQEAARHFWEQVRPAVEELGGAVQSLGDEFAGLRGEGER